MTEISVIIPTYNRPDYLPGAIETVRGQTHDSVEIIVVDDGSEEDYATAVCEGYDEVDLYKHTENRGLSAARNTGIKHAEGDYIAFLDDDDRWHQSKLHRQVQALEKNPDSGVASCLVCGITPEKEVLRPELNRPSGDLTKELLRSNVIGTPSRVLIRSECLNDHKFDEQLDTKQDWDLFLRISYDWDVTVVNDYLCYRMIHESMSSDPRSFERDRRKIINKHIADIDRWGDLDATLADYYTELGRVRYGSGDVEKSREAYSTALSYELAIRTVYLYLLTFLPRSVFDQILRMKRGFETRKSDVAGPNPQEVPGL